MINEPLGRTVDMKTFESALFTAAYQVGLNPKVAVEEQTAGGHTRKEIQCDSRLGYGIRVFLTDAFGDTSGIAYIHTGRSWPILVDRKARQYVEAVRWNL